MAFCNELITISRSYNRIIQRSGNFSKKILSEQNALEILNNFDCNEIRLSLLSKREKFEICKTYPNPFKILLVTSYGTVSGDPMRMSVPNIGLISIYDRFNKYLEFDCRYLDPNIVGKNRLFELISNEHFDIVGFSVLNSTLHNDIELISKIKALNSKIKIVIGGLTINTFSNDILEYVQIDFIIKGDGFQGIKKLLIGDQKLCQDTIIDLETSSLDLFYDNKLFDTINYKNYSESIFTNYLPYNCAGNKPLRIRMTESCGGYCTYCNIPKRRNYKKSIKEIIKTIELYQNEYDSIEFEDHEFTYNNVLVTEVCQYIVNHNLSFIPKQCCTRVDSVSKNHLNLMKKAGFKIINYGIESFNQDILNFFNKKVTVKDNIDAIEATFSAGMKPGINLILFSPLETEETICDTIRAVTPFAQRGATINAVLKVTVSYGDKANKIDSHIPYIESEPYFFEGMIKEWYLPKSLAINKDLESLYCEVKMMSNAFSKSFIKIHNRHPSVSLISIYYLLCISKIMGMTEKYILENVKEAIISAENKGALWTLT
jgi:radical SAM superfamily enzyme YgiQ (UPF0313 family)